MEDDRGLPGGFSTKDNKLYGYTLKPPILPPFNPFNLTKIFRKSQIFLESS